ncbi:2,3-bisphosphoglycerate-independent phosphoglycerate mutase [Candidatus Bathyarchaeota archaeon]|nr:2,3-bisphosphoglycerate-independent phosphoglycerate mutase [Candidatus Bathyarchaeota archaeon]
MKLLYIVIDGLGDLPISELKGETPLGFAETPNLDELAGRGKLGLMYTVGKGIAPESDVAVISILGYDPSKYHVGRGPLEAFGAGLDMKDGDLALRCNFATLGANRRIIDRRVGRSLTTEEATELSKAINREVKLESFPAEFDFKNTLGHRAVLVIKSKDVPLSAEITNTDPAYERVEGMGVAKAKFEMILKEAVPLEDTEGARRAAALVNEFTEKSHEVLDGHEINRRREAEGKLKANVILSRDAGNKVPKFFNIGERYGVRFACLADMPVERGISRLAGMHLIDLPPPTKDVRADSAIRIRKLMENYGSFDCFYIHIKGPDEPGHDGDYRRKVEIIEQIDKFFFGALLSKIDLEENLICVTADHSTPCILKAHSDDPVPLLIAGGKVKPDGINRFSEEACKKGSLGVLSKGSNLIPLLMKMMREK